MVLFSLFELIVLVLKRSYGFHRMISSRPTVYSLPSSKQQSHTVRYQKVSIVEHLAAMEPDIFLRSW